MITHLSVNKEVNYVWKPRLLELEQWSKGHGSDSQGMHELKNAYFECNVEVRVCQMQAVSRILNLTEYDKCTFANQLSREKSFNWARA